MISQTTMMTTSAIPCFFSTSLRLDHLRCSSLCANLCLIHLNILFIIHHVVDQSIFHGLLCVHDVVAVGILLDPF